MDVFDCTKAFTEFWSAQRRALRQKQAGKAVAEGMRAATAALPAMPGFATDLELALPGGHVGVFVGGKPQKLFAPAVATFLQRHEQALIA